MARYTFQGMVNFINAGKLSAAELRELLDLAQNKYDATRESEQHLARALQELDVLARNFAENCGVKSVSSARELIARIDGLSVQKVTPSAPKSRRKTTEIRKPYLNPYAPTEIFSLAKHHPIPGWAEKLLAAGWSKEELHYKRIPAALRARGETVSYDYVQIHSQLVKENLRIP